MSHQTKSKLDLDASMIKHFDPSKHVLKKRNHRFVIVDKQIVRYERAAKKRRASEAKAEAEVDVTKLYG